MVTTTTSPLAARRLPAYHGVDPAPAVKPPPWIQTITGRPPSSDGVQMLSERQSSPVGICPAPSIVSSGDGFCGAIAPKAVASSTPSHGSTGCGGWNRAAVAKRMPRNCSTPPLSMPWTLPVAVLAITARNLLRDRRGHGGAVGAPEGDRVVVRPRHLDHRAAVRPGCDPCVGPGRRDQ